MVLKWPLLPGYLSNEEAIITFLKCVGVLLVTLMSVISSDFHHDRGTKISDEKMSGAYGEDVDSLKLT